MYRSVSVLAGLALMGCINENNFRDQLDLEVSGEGRPVESQTHTDVIVQTTTPTVDILYMVDNSCSMGDDQDDLAANFPTFMRWFLGSGLDYHIGVVSSDIRDPGHTGKLQGGFGKKWIETKDANQIARFQQMAVLGNGGASPEKGIAGIWYSKTNDAALRHNEGFYREESDLHVICVSDERDYSQGEVSLGEFINWFDGLKRNADQRSFSAIESPAVGASGGGGQSYGLVTQEIGGVVWDIGVDDWSPALDILGLRASGRKTEYFLSKQPVDPSIVVTVRIVVDNNDDNYSEQIYPRSYRDEEGEFRLENGEEPDGPHWYYVEGRNSITFVDYVPEDLSRVAITYTVRSSVVDEQLGEEPEAGEE